MRRQAPASVRHCSEYEQDDIVLEQPRPDSRLLVLYYSVIAYPQAMQGKGVSHFRHYALAATARELNADLFAVSNAWSDAMKATCESLGMKPDQKRSGSNCTAGRPHDSPGEVLRQGLEPEGHREVIPCAARSAPPAHRSRACEVRRQGRGQDPVILIICRNRSPGDTRPLPPPPSWRRRLGSRATSWRRPDTSACGRAGSGGSRRPRRPTPRASPCATPTEARRRLPAEPPGRSAGLGVE